jgi:type II secretory pathway component PulM
MLRDFFENLLERVRAIVAPLARQVVSRAGPVISPYARQVRARVDPYIEQGRARYQKLEPRERVLVQIAAVLVGALIVYNFVYLPIIGIGTSLQDKIAERQHDLVDVRRLVATYSALKTDVATAERRTVPLSRDFSLFSVIEGAMTKSVGHDKIASIAPGTDRKVSDNFTEYSVQLKLNNVSLQQVVDALYSISNLPVPVGVDNLHIARRTPDTHSFDVDLECVALARNG